MSRSSDSPVVEALDAKIAELEREAQELQKAIQRLSSVSASLDALRKARAVMAAGSEPVDGSVAHTNGTGPQTQPPFLNVQDVPKPDILQRLTPGSIGFIAIEVLRQAGKPLHVDELLPLVQAQRKPKLAESTLVSTLCGYVNNKTPKLKRVSPNVYGLL